MVGQLHKLVRTSDQQAARELANASDARRWRARMAAGGKAWRNRRANLDVFHPGASRGVASRFFERATRTPPSLSRSLYARHFFRKICLVPGTSVARQFFQNGSLTRVFGAVPERMLGSCPSSGVFWVVLLKTIGAYYSPWLRRWRGANGETVKLGSWIRTEILPSWKPSHSNPLPRRCFEHKIIGKNVRFRQPRRVGGFS